MTSQEQMSHHCKHCQMTFKGGDNLIIHQICDSVKPLTCPDCQSQFEDIDELVKCYQSHPQKKTSTSIARSEPTEGSSQKDKIESKSVIYLPSGNSGEYHGKTVNAFVNTNQPAGDRRLPQPHDGEASAAFPKTFLCPSCGDTFESECELKTHEKLHSDEAGFLCSQCGQRFIRERSYIAHKRTHMGSGKKKVYECTLCGKACVTSGDLTVHMRSHTGEKPYPCFFCEKRFTKSSYLVEHQRTHTGEKPYTCVICGANFAQSGALSRHTRSHTGEKPYHCSMCDKKFAKSTSLTIHERTHTGERPFECQLCDKKFTQNALLTAHTRTHTGEKPFQCPFCGKGFAQSSNLTAHKRLHTGEKPFHCTVCGQSFTKRNTLTVHARTHSGEKPFPCSICGKRFRQSSTLNDHRRIHTGEKPHRRSSGVKRYVPSSDLVVHPKSEPEEEDTFHCMERAHLLEHSYVTTDCGHCYILEPGICEGNDQCEGMWMNCTICNDGLILKSSQIVTPVNAEAKTDKPHLFKHAYALTSCGRCFCLDPNICEDNEQCQKSWAKCRNCKEGLVFKSSLRVTLQNHVIE